MTKPRIHKDKNHMLPTKPYLSLTDEMTFTVIYVNLL